MHTRRSWPPKSASWRRPSFSPLTRLCGVDLLTAGRLAAILGPGNRFASDAQLASYAGAAPLEASSAGHVRHRLNRGGNRLNHVLYLIVLTQAHHLPAAKAYLDRRVSEGKSRREAHRALKRFVVRAIWKLWQECQQNRKAAICEVADVGERQPTRTDDQSDFVSWMDVNARQ